MALARITRIRNEDAHPSYVGAKHLRGLCYTRCRHHLRDDDRENLQKRFINAKQKVFEEGELSANPGPQTLVIKTYLTDGTPSNAPVNWVATVVVGSVDVGNAALYSQGFIGERRVGAASGAYDGKLIP